MTSEWVDTRLEQPMQLTWKRGVWRIVIDERRNADEHGKIVFDWYVFRDGDLIEDPACPKASGTIDTIDCAKDVTRAIVDCYAGKEKVLGPIVGPGSVISTSETMHL